VKHRSQQRGGVLVEFAIVSLILYFILSATIEYGRIMFAIQVVQDASRLAARELAITPMPTDITFEDALARADVKSRIWDAAKLVVDATGTDAQVNARFDALPLVNRALRPLMIYDDFSCPASPVFRYPGQLVLSDPGNQCSFTGEVTVPKLNPDQTCCVDLPVLAEVRADAASGPFSGANLAVSPNGVVAVMVQYPFQAATLSAYQPRPAGEPNAGLPIEVNEPGPVQAGTYTGQYGMGAQYAMGKTVRPYRRILTGQSFFRREVME
jgi:Flp pilus assembly protein TadG